MHRRTKKVLQGLLLLFCLVCVPLVMGLVAGTVVTNHILFDNFSMEINSDTANEIEFRKVGGEDVSINLGTSNTVALSSDSGVTTFDFGAASAVTGVSSLTGESTGAIKGMLYEIENVTANDVLTTAECGKWFVVDGNTATVSLTLPAVGAADDGCWFVVVDANEAAASDVTMEPGTGDSINGAAANVGFTSDGADELPCACMFIYDHSNTNWIALPMQLTVAWDSDGS